MSSIPTQHFNGDTSFGRNTYTGGNVTVRGNSKICRNLLVQGWLDAPNLKSPYKGLFPNADLLNSLYATPRPGWWALVGTILPAELWMVNDGSWVNTGNMVDAPGLETQLNLYLEDFAAINGTIEALSNRIDALVGENASEAIDNFNEILAFLAGMSDDA